uniref:Uncharacterized protein n=1 Tax=Brassica oleracea TaxID=3712 RepID=A0A3P6E328_BRAOL|nr:unnamed protein product [Brassica oleracea]
MELEFRLFYRTRTLLRRRIIRFIFTVTISTLSLKGLVTLIPRKTILSLTSLILRLETLWLFLLTDGLLSDSWLIIQGFG